MTASIPGSAEDPGVPGQQDDGLGGPPDGHTVPPVRTGSWWQSHRRRVWLWLAFLAAVTAPLWGGLILLWLFSPSSPFPQSP